MKLQVALDVVTRREIEDCLGYALDSEEAQANPEAVFMVIHDYARQPPRNNEEWCWWANARRTAASDGLEFELLQSMGWLKALYCLIAFRPRYVTIATYTLTAGSPYLV